MLSCIVPLAGPQFDMPDGSTKAETDVDGMPLLRRAIESRSWWQRAELEAQALIFVLRDTGPSRRLASERLSDWYPGSRHLFLSHHSNGAALSALAGAALTGGGGETLVVDLADILYRDSFDPIRAFSGAGAGAGAGGAALTFRSANPAYSYLETDDRGDVVRAVEKRVISTNASAGTYFFKNPSTFIRAVAHALDHRDEQSHAGNLFVCPLMNGVIAGGARVVLGSVDEVRDLKIVDPI